MELRMVLLQITLLAILFLETFETTAITTRGKSVGKIREDRLEYAVTVDKLLYAAKFLQRFGYIKKSKKLNSLTHEELKITIRKPLKRYQAFNGLEITGILDEATSEQILLPRCSGSDENNDDNDDNGDKIYLPSNKHKDSSESADFRSGFSPVTVNRWKKKVLTFKVSRVPLRFEEDKVIKHIKTAAKHWQDASGLTLNYVQPSQYADIDFSFMKIDEKMNVLGRALYPPVGKVFFDSVENWDFSDGDKRVVNKGPKFLNVVVHEFGHALGIKHLPYRKSIMYPTYLRDKPHALTQDDIKAIQILFGEAPKDVEKDHVVRTLPATIKKKKSETKDVDLEEAKVKDAEESEQDSRQKKIKTTKTKDINTKKSKAKKGKAKSRIGRRQKNKRKQNKRKQNKRKKNRRKRKRASQRTTSVDQPNILDLLNIGNIGRRVVPRVSGTKKIVGSGGTSYNTEAIVRRVGGNTDSVVVVNGKVITGKKRQEAVINKLPLLHTNPNQPSKGLVIGAVETGDEITTIQADITTDKLETTTELDTTTTVSTTTLADSTADSSNGAKQDQATTAADVTTISEQTTSTQSTTTIGLITTTAKKIKLIKDAIIPANTPLAVRAVSMKNLADVSKVTNWNGQLAWHPVKFTSNRLLVMGLQDGLEVVNTASTLSLVMQEARVLHDKEVLQQRVKEMLIKGPGKMLSSNGVLHVINKGQSCILSVINTDISVLAGTCGSEGYYDGGRIAAKFHNPIDMCSDPSGDIYILDEGNSKIRLFSQYNRTVSTFFNLPKDVKFESMHCTGSYIYLSANDKSFSYVYKLSMGDRAPASMEKLVRLARGDGSSGSLLSGVASARGPFTQLIEIYGHFLINDGGLLRDLNMQTGNIYTVCHQRKLSKVGIPGVCEISHLDSLHKIDNNIFGMDIKQNQLIMLMSNYS